MLPNNLDRLNKFSLGFSKGSHSKIIKLYSLNILKIFPNSAAVISDTLVTLIQQFFKSNFLELKFDLKSRIEDSFIEFYLQAGIPRNFISP